jgi:hypothetical protein
MKTSRLKGCQIHRGLGAPKTPTRKAKVQARRNCAAAARSAPIGLWSNSGGATGTSRSLRTLLRSQPARGRGKYSYRLIEQPGTNSGKARTQRKVVVAAKCQSGDGFGGGTLPAICPATMRSQEAGGRVSELRRYSRQTRATPVVLETRGGWLRLPLIDLSPGGAKVRLTEPLKEGAPGRLYFLPPHWRPRAIEVIVWRIDLDGVVLLFTGASIIPPAARWDVRPPDSWLWTWKARAASGEGRRGRF